MLKAQAGIVELNYGGNFGKAVLGHLEILFSWSPSPQSRVRKAVIIVLWPPYSHPYWKNSDDLLAGTNPRFHLQTAVCNTHPDEPDTRQALSQSADLRETPERASHFHHFP